MESVGLKLRRINNTIRRFLENDMEKYCGEKISGINILIIGFLSKNSNKDIYQKDLEKEFEITRSTASKIINLMEKKGLIERKNVSHDARLRRIVLTKNGVEFSKVMKNNAEKMENRLISGLSDEEIEALCSLLDKIKRNITKGE